VSQHLDTAASQATPAGTQEQHTGRRLGAFLCWAVVFADIGTSVYYVPGILFGDPARGTGVGDLAGLFVTMTMAVFVLLALKYSEVSVRFPEGGGVVSVAARGINPWAGAVGGMFILTSYFLTSAISSLSGVQYFETLVPALSNLSLQLIITVILVGLLGLLNWYGIKESAVVSAGIAVAAFLSDIVILILILVRVPMNVIGQVFAEMFSGQKLTAPLVITGYAGAFLAFSGLESISQLSPVMALPRSKTVSRALALVVLTVGISSPLLTIFSTTLLTKPELLAQTNLLAPHVTTMPSLANQFISQLGYSTGGRLLEVFTAVTASTLLLFASNTAIIGAYHVFLALSRMQFFPKLIERKDRRDSPYIAILLATAIPMFVLVGVGGRIDLLGDMYAFGLLGAFALTCLGLDVIRLRERRGSLSVGSREEAEEAAIQPAAMGRPPLGTQLRAVLEQRLAPLAHERLREATARVAALGAEIARIAAPAVRVLRAAWPNVNYYLGFLTTLLVSTAWIINLRTKPLATIFGGGLTVLGVAISVVNYRYQQSRGVAPVVPEYYLRPMPRSLLVALDPRSPNNAAVVRAACQSAQGHPLVILALGHPELREVRAFEIAVPYFNDVLAQQTLSLAASICGRERVQAHYVYRVDTPNAVLDAWRIIQPDEIIAEAELAKTITKRVSPDTVRIQRTDGVKVVHALKRRVSRLESAVGRERPERRGAAKTAEQPAEALTAPPGTLAAKALREHSPFTVPPAPPSGSRPAGAASPNGTKPAEQRREKAPPEGPRAEERPTEPVGAPSAAPSAPPAPTVAEETPVEAEGTDEGETPIQPQTGAAPSNVDLDQYVWTGTDYVRLDELDEAEREAREGERSAGTAGDNPGTSGQADAPNTDERAGA
jgi:amino acid transporter